MSGIAFCVIFQIKIIVWGTGDCVRWLWFGFGAGVALLLSRGVEFFKVIEEIDSKKRNISILMTLKRITNEGYFLHEEFVFDFVQLTDIGDLIEIETEDFEIAKLFDSIESK